MRPPFRRSSIKYFLAILASPSERHYAVAWLLSWQPNYLLRRPLPWLSFGAIKYFETHLPANARVFEYGSGGSTLYWLDCGASCVSIEHDPAWYDTVRSRLPRGALVDYRLVQPDRIDTDLMGDPADPYDYRSADRDLRPFSFQNYVTQIDTFADGWFDLILIDGRARPACIRHGARKVRIGGWLVLDNADRDYYLAQSQCFLDDFDGHSFVGAVPATEFMGRTDVYVRTG
jgi:hypothetical protein